MTGNEYAVTLVRALDAAWNSQDLERAVEVYADDAVSQITPPVNPEGSVFRGKDQVRGFIATLLPGFQVESANIRGDGDRINWHGDLQGDTFRALGIGVVPAAVEATVRDGKVVTFTVHLPDDVAQKVRAAMAERQN